ncbi:hypothetical protein F441_01604 [Phytophthora nicotianae CJ01A1]|uniref:Uncharacterized protein n=2 Tax=Phytophthora nicotianae TaxID=4792 RepID=W2XS43_PHYNI|nr:hypothetical protein F441_01604 [Phytophthora nicotianae CJ01A1]
MFRVATPLAKANTSDPRHLEIDLASLLRSIPSSAISTSAWHAFTAEVICLAQRSCEVGYNNVATYQPSFINVGKIAAIYRICTFADTKWRVTVYDMEFIYSPTSGSLDVTTPAFQRWIEELSGKVPFELIVRVGSWDGTVISDAASFEVKFYGGYDTVTGRYTMLHPALVPVFEVAGGTESGGVDNIQYAGANYTMWDIKLWSIGQTPRYDKFLDLLEIGLGGTATTPTPSSTVVSPTQEISSTDPCRKCSWVLARCQNDSECVSLTRDSLILLLTSTQSSLQTPMKTTVVDDYGTTAFRGDLYPLMVSLNRAYSSKAWDLLAGEFFCLANGSYDMEYSDVYVDNTMEHMPTKLELVPSVKVELRTYGNTEWDVQINGVVFSYKPIQVSTSSTDYTLPFQNWLRALGSDDSVKLEFQVVNRVFSNLGAITLSIRVFGSFDQDQYQYLMVNPTKIPQFSAVGGLVDIGDGFPRAEANVTLPSMVISSTRQKPQYTKMLKMLSDGIDNSIPVPTTTPTSISRSILSDDTCRQCQDDIALCRDDTDCVESSRDRLVPLLREYGWTQSTSAENEYGSARVSLNLTQVLLTPDIFLSRQGWDLFAAELTCLSISCDLEYGDVASPLLGFHIPTFVNNIFGASVVISLRTYADTAWNIHVNNELLSYTIDTSDTRPIYDAAMALREWIASQLLAYDLLATMYGPEIDSVSGAAILRMYLSGYNMYLAPPWLIPRFEAVGGVTGGADTGLPVAEANVKPWEISLISHSQKPQYGKFLDLLAFGLGTPT